MKDLTNLVFGRINSNMIGSKHTIDKGDYAILYAVLLEEWPAFLLAEEKTMHGIDRPFPGLTRRELSDHFFRLWSNGLIECSEGESEPPVAADFELAREQFEHAENWARPFQDVSIYFRLTDAGGKVWEHFASPDWSKFFSSHIGSGPKEWTLSASSRVPIELARKCRRIRPVPLKGTEKWEILEPWQATYGKELPVGHRLTYQYNAWDMPETIDEEEIRAWEEFAPFWGEWYKSFQQLCEEHFGGA